MAKHQAAETPMINPNIGASFILLVMREEGWARGRG